MIDLTGIQNFESRGKTVHSHYDGREIRRIFHLEPYSKAPDVVEGMLGSVTREGDTANWTRHFPVQDPQYADCYCNEVRTDLIDPRACSVSGTLGLDSLKVSGAPQAAYTMFMQQVNSVPDDPAGGCFLTASYRPLISAYQPGYSAHEQDGRIFDWINPDFTPAVRTSPWPDGLLIAVKDPNNVPIATPGVPDEVAQPVNIPVIEFSVKRLLVGEVPYSRLNSLLNTVNQASWPVDGSRLALPTFAKGTLRFDNYKIIKHYSRASTNGFWYELVYYFLWLSLKDKPVYGEDGELSGENGFHDVTWNHCLMRPRLQLPAFPDILALDLGWYFVVKTKKANWAKSEYVSQIGPLYSFADFDPLFRLNP